MTPKLIAIVGTTASGKSSLGLQIAQKYDGEIICADSRTIYKGMDIGTAKPTPADQSLTPHHMLDIVQPGESFTVADFKNMAETLINDISARHKLPIIVGGTGLYVDSILFDYKFSKPEDTHIIRVELNNLTIEDLRAMLVQKNIPHLENEKNKRHIIRMLEKGEGQRDDDRRSLRPEALIIGLQCSSSVLRARIEERVEAMFRQGLRKEVTGLVERFGWGSEALTGIGYREFKAYDEGTVSMSHVKRTIVQDTLHFAKRQRTWFKRNPAIHWVEHAEDSFALIDHFLEAN